ncbi:ABC transporter ATP-binding protein [Lysinibacillus sphaericus]|uniref:ABC transporter ATP-binding protein n=1 Tax=Lysinibacillus sphaericus TaxID=1421 RepID=UPI001C5E6E6D
MKMLRWNLQLIFVLILQFFAAVVSVLFPIALMYITDSLIELEIEKLIPLFGICLLFGVGQMVLHYFAGVMGNRYIANHMMYLRSSLHRAMISTSYDEFKKYNTEEYNTLYFSNLNQLEANYYSSIFSMINKGLLLSCSIITLIILQPILTLALVVIIGLVSTLPVLFSKRIIRLKEEHISANEQYVNIIQEMIAGFSILKVYRKADNFSSRGDKVVKNLELKNMKLQNMIILANVLFGSITIVVMLVIFLFGGYLVSQQLLTIGALIAFIQLIMYVIEPAISIAQEFNKVNSTKPIRKQIQIISDLPVAQYMPLENDVISTIKLRNVSYYYKNDDKPILNELNLCFEKGKSYALVGENGSGKSTILKIIAGLIEQYSGELLINDVQQKGPYLSVGYVDQNNFLFKDTLWNNIQFFKDNDTEIQTLLKNLKFDNLEERLQLDVGCNGDHLSGGQRQKVSIARALIGNPQVLLLDEPSSALDKENVKVLYNVISTLRDCICIMVTHDEELITSAFDVIIKLKDGEAEIEDSTYVSVS